MLSWITGSRSTSGADELADKLDATFLEPPETPAHLFPVRAFKQAIWGSPHPDGDAQTASKEKSGMRRIQKKSKSVDIVNGLDLATAPAQTGPTDYTKPSGILMTPGTASKGRKTVSFGAQVVDNEGKKPVFSKSGLPNDFPGKFPSPWTPRTVSTPEEQKGRTKLTEALYEARDSAKSERTTISKPRAKDDTDITLDLSKPRSESGKYWKEQYETFAENSMKETKKLIDKQKLTKKYAMKRDQEATDLSVQLEKMKKQHATQLKSLESQNKELHGKLRAVTAENVHHATEIASLKQQMLRMQGSSSKRSTESHSIRVFQEPFAEANPPISLDTPSRDRRTHQSRAQSSQGSRPGSSRRNTSPGVQGSLRRANIASNRRPLKEIEANSVAEVITSSGDAKTQKEVTLRSSSPDPWVQDAQDFGDYVSPSKLDRLDKTGFSSPKANPGNIATQSIKPTFDVNAARSRPSPASLNSHRPRRHSITSSIFRSRPLYAPASHMRVQSAVEPKLGMSVSNNSFTGSTSSRRTPSERAGSMDADRAAKARARLEQRRKVATGGSHRT